jgi:hypothetical protein
MIMLQNDADLIIDLIRMDERVVSVRLYPALTIFRSYVSPTVFSRLQEGHYSSSGILLYCVVHVILQIPTKYDGYKSTTDTVVAINKRESCEALVMSWAVDSTS